MADLTTLGNVREYQQKASGQSTGQDALVSSLIVRASSMLQNTLGREFTPTAGQTRVIPYTGGGTVNVARMGYDLRTVTAVSYDSSSPTPVSLVSSQWALRPSYAPDSVYWSVYLPDYVRDSRRVNGDIPDMTVTVTGNWGFAAVPADVEHGAIVTVTTWLREGGVFTPEGDVVRFERVGRVPPDVIDGLSHYLRPVV